MTEHDKVFEKLRTLVLGEESEQDEWCVMSVAAVRIQRLEAELEQERSALKLNERWNSEYVDLLIDKDELIKKAMELLTLPDRSYDARGLLQQALKKSDER